MKRRSFALVLALIFCIGIISGCKGNNGKTGDDDDLSASEVEDIFGDDNEFEDDEDGFSDSSEPGENGDGENSDKPNSPNSPSGKKPIASVGDDTGTTNPSSRKLIGNTYTSGFPIVKDKITLKVLAYSRPSHASNWDLMRFTKLYEEKTNIRIEWIIVPQASLNDRIKLVFSTQNYPDIMVSLAGILYDSDVYTYGTQGVLWDMSQSMPTYAPNVFELLKNDKTLRMAVQQQNNAIYSLPYINSDYPGSTGHAWTINKKWLNKLGLKAPKTTDELENVLLAFKNNDPDGDGIANQIPFLTFCYMPEMFGPWGLYFDWGNNVMIDNSNKVQFVFTQNEMREAVLYWKNLKRQGLYDITWSERTTTEMAQMINSGKVGMFLWGDPYTSVSMDVLKDYEVIDVPKATTGVGSNFTPGVMKHNSHVFGNSTFIFNTCKHKEAALRWLDYFYSYEGNAFKTYLDVGYKYLHKDSKGNIYVKIKEGDNTLNDTPGSVLPGIYDDHFFNSYFAKNPNQTEREKFSGQWSNTVRSMYKTKVPKYIWPDITFTAAEIKTIKRYETYLNFDTCWYSIRRMIEGGSDVVDPATGWNTWVNSKTKAGLAEYVSVHQKAYDRASK